MVVSSLLELVDELILSVVEQIHDLDTLRNLALTCSRLQTLAEPAIYRNIFLRTREDDLALATSIVSRPHRLQGIRRIECRQQYGTEEYGLDVLVRIVRGARNLQELTLESPFCNRIQDQAQRGWAESLASMLRPVCDFSVPRLRTLTLHLSLEDVRYWRIYSDNALMFAHPTLKSLKLSCATLGDDLETFLKDRPPTPLKHLALIECNITQKALSSILALPKALEKLSLGEEYAHPYTGRENSVGFNLLFSKSPVAFLESLQQQQHSLVSFGYATREIQSSSTPSRTSDFNALGCTGFSGFGNLEEMSLQGCSPNFRALLESPRTAPPALQRLSFIESDIHHHFPQRTLPEDPEPLPWSLVLCETIPSLQLVELVSRKVPRGTVQRPSLLAAMHGKKLQLKLFRRSGEGAIPPFLFGERPYLDEHRCTWESGRVTIAPEMAPSARPVCTAIEYA